MKTSLRILLRPFQNGACFVLKRRNRRYYGEADSAKLLGKKVVLECREIGRPGFKRPIFNSTLEFFDWKQVVYKNGELRLVDGQHELNLSPLSK